MLQAVRGIKDPFAQHLVARLGQGAVALTEIHETYADQLVETYLTIQNLWSAKALELLNKASGPDVSVRSGVSGDMLDLSVPAEASVWKLSRFAYAHRSTDDMLTIQSPRSTATINLLSARATELFFFLRKPVTAEDLHNSLGWEDSLDETKQLLFLLRLAAVAEPCDSRGNGPEDVRSDLMQWEFHDLLFHSRSRQGRHDAPIGADFRFRGRLRHEPPVKPNPWRANAIPLYRPSAVSMASSDPPFSAVLESRRSIRDHNDFRPITLEQLGEFLYRTARIRYRFQSEFGEFTSRPYPNGGASYELELYITINRCSGLGRGFYYYDPEAHLLCLIQPPSEDLEKLLDDAWQSAARLCRPQVLITIASRFHRVSWKYSGMAYAAQLKNTGVLYQTMYLVATAMNLAACGLGLGDTARFCRLSGTNYFEEGSIGEFMLGNAT